MSQLPLPYWKRPLRYFGLALDFVIRWSLRALWILAVQLTLVIMAGLLWLALSEQAPKLVWEQLAAYAPDVHIEGIQGRFATGLEISRFSWMDDKTRIDATGVHLRWQATDLLQGRFTLDELHIAELVITDRVVSDTSLVLPRLSSPLAWAVHSGQIEVLRYQPWQSDAFVLRNLNIVAEGAGSAVTLTQVNGQYAAGSANPSLNITLGLAGQLKLVDQWPLQLTLIASMTNHPVTETKAADASAAHVKTINSQAVATSWPEQRISLDGDLSALKITARGPAKWPFALQARVNVLPVVPEFSGVLSWPQWLLPGQQDWRLSPGSLSFKGTQQSGTADLDLALTLQAASALPWPAHWPRRAFLASALAWTDDSHGLALTAKGKGRFGEMPWLLDAQALNKAAPAPSAARSPSQRQGKQGSQYQGSLRMQLADAGIQLDYDTDLRFAVKVPSLQRFQAAYAGALDAKGIWQGTLTQGGGQLDLVLASLRQGQTALVDHADLSLKGSVAEHQAVLSVSREQTRARLQLQGQADLAKAQWKGLLNQGEINTAGLAWHLRAPAALSVSETEQHFSEQCWQLQSKSQAGADSAASAAMDDRLRQWPWQVCLQADLLPTRWQALLNADSGGAGHLQATLRRDPRQHEPALDADLSLSELDLARLPLSLPPNLLLRGLVSAQVRLSGTLAAPQVNGQFGLSAAQVAYPAFAINWQPIQLQGRLLGDHLDWQGSLRDTQGGQASLNGAAQWRSESGSARFEHLQWAVQAQLDGQTLTVVYPPWVKARVSPKISLTLKPGHIGLSGQVQVPDALISLQQVESSGVRPSRDVRIVRERNGNAPAQSLAERSEQLPLDMTLAVILGNNVRVKGMGLDAGLHGQVTLTQTGDRPLAANGDINLSDDARYEAYGQLLTLRNGSLSFAGPLQQPSIRLEAVRVIDPNTVNEITVGVRLSGPASAPVPVLFSDQTLSQEEILSLLVMGRSLNTGGVPTQNQRQALALGAALKLGGNTTAFQSLASHLGIKDFAIGTDGDNDNTQVAVSGHIRPDLYVSFGMGVFNPVQTAKVRYQLTRSLSLEAMTSLESAITLFYSFRF